jgi:hypothetical protein
MCVTLLVLKWLPRTKDGAFDEVNGKEDCVLEHHEIISSKYQ